MSNNLPSIDWDKLICHGTRAKVLFEVLGDQIPRDLPYFTVPPISIKDSEQVRRYCEGFQIQYHQQSKGIARVLWYKWLHTPNLIYIEEMSQFAYENEMVVTDAVIDIMKTNFKIEIPGRILNPPGGRNGLIDRRTYALKDYLLREKYEEKQVNDIIAYVRSDLAGRLMSLGYDGIAELPQRDIYFVQLFSPEKFIILDHVEVSYNMDFYRLLTNIDLNKEILADKKLDDYFNAIRSLTGRKYTGDLKYNTDLLGHFDYIKNNSNLGIRRAIRSIPSASNPLIR